MRGTAIALLGLLVFCGARVDALAEAKMPLAKNPPKIFLDANRKRFTKTEGGDFDDKKQKVQLEITVRNLDLNGKVNGLTLHYWALAQSAEDRRVYKVIDAGEFPVSLDNTAEGREIQHKGEEVVLQYDDTGYAKFGVAYKGCLLVVLNAEKEVVAVKASQPAWQTNFERAFDLRKGSWCDGTLKSASKPGGG